MNTFPIRCITKAKTTFVNLRLLFNAQRHISVKSLEYNDFGEPHEVVKLKITETDHLKPAADDVLVRMLAAPVNPADINTIQGKYPVNVTFPYVPGNEGVGVVEETGPDVKHISPGDKVILVKTQQGTWRNLVMLKPSVLRVVPKHLGVIEAATLSVNPTSAYRMLLDFVDVKEGKVVIQNGANSTCGQSVIQLCKAWDIPNINIVRNRPEIDDLKKYLKSLGATFVLTEEELIVTNIFKEKLIDKPSLALNCVGGKNALEMSKNLHHSGKMVTYGGMSREPVSIPTSALIFKNISFHGFWMTQWNEIASQIEKDTMFDDLIKLISCNKLKAPLHKMVEIDSYKEALKDALSAKGFAGYKYILDFKSEM